MRVSRRTSEREKVCEVQRESVCVCLRVHAFVKRERESLRWCGENQCSVFKEKDTACLAPLPLRGLYHYRGLTLWTIPSFPPPALTLAFEGNTCARESQDNGLSPGKQGDWMTSVEHGLAGGKRETADHGLPALVNGVRDQGVQQACWNVRVIKDDLTEWEQNTERGLQGEAAV